MVGGIASYLLSIYRRYLGQTEFQAIVPDTLDPGRFPFPVHQAPFRPFALERARSNEILLALLRDHNSDVILFGYLRSHPEVGPLYQRERPDACVAIVTHGKEAFLGGAVTDQTHLGQSHRGYAPHEVSFYRRLLRRADRVFAVSRFTSDVLRRDGVFENVAELPPSIEMPPQRNGAANPDLLDIPPGGPVLLSVGRLIERKGHRRVIDAVARLRPRFSDLRYLIIGDGPEREILNRLVVARGLTRHVRFLGAASETVKEASLQACDVFVLPCDHIGPNDVEGFGIVFLEAAAHGKPAVAGRSGGVPEAVIDGETGILVEPGQTADLAAALARLLSDADLRERMGKAARHHASRYAIEPTSGELVDLFQHLRRKRRSA